MAKHSPRRLRTPTQTEKSRYEYSISPRDKKTFNTVLDATDLIDRSGRPMIIEVDTHRPTDHGTALVLDVEIPILGGRIIENMVCDHIGGELHWAELERQVENHDGRTVRRETADLRDGTLPMPVTAYPEVMLPFLLGSQITSHGKGSLHAWINDRFVARVDYEQRGRGSVRMPSGKRSAIEAVMYPDFNDWVNMGKVLTKLAWPFVPKYHIWFAAEAPYQVLKFEGSYGPPGAPEIVLELRE